MDTHNFINVWKSPSSLSSISFGIMIAFGFMYLHYSTPLLLYITFIMVFITFLIEIWIDYKNREWYRWKINKLKKEVKENVE